MKRQRRKFSDRAKHLGNRRGQTTVEYLLLMALTFITAYIMITGPISTFTADMINRLRAGMGNMVQNGDLTSGPIVQPGTAGHPGDLTRLKRLH